MTIEERADAYVGHPEEIDEFTSATIKRDAYIRGAKEQKAIDEEVRLKKCDDMTEAEYNRETAFVDWYLKNGKGAPTFSDAIEWARRKLIDKVSDLKEMPCLAELGDWQKCANYVLDEIGNFESMTMNEIVYAVVGKVFEYSNARNRM